MADIRYHGPVVIFDLDDTLFRERDFCRSGFAFLCDRDRYRVLPISDYPGKDCLDNLRETMSRELIERRNPFVPFENFFMPLAEETHLDWNLQAHISAYRNHKPLNLEFAEGAKEILEFICENKIKTGLITDGRSVTQRRKIEALKLENFFEPDHILISEETGVDKHSSEPFKRFVRIFPEASEFYYVGDNPAKDFYHPNLLGWTTIQVPFNSDNVHPQSPPPSPLHAPAYILQNYLSLKQLIIK